MDGAEGWDSVWEGGEYGDADHGTMKKHAWDDKNRGTGSQPDTLSCPRMEERGRNIASAEMAAVSRERERQDLLPK